MARRRPRAIGTAAESAVVRWLVDYGFPDAERLPLHGNRDHGDIVMCRQPRIVLEVKAGAAAESASAGLIGQWLDQTETERVNAHADAAALVVRRFRRPVSLWDVHAPLWAVVHMVAPVTVFDRTPVRLTLADFADLTHRWAGEWS